MLFGARVQCLFLCSLLFRFPYFILFFAQETLLNKWFKTCEEQSMFSAKLRIGKCRYNKCWNGFAEIDTKDEERKK